MPELTKYKYLLTLHIRTEIKIAFETFVADEVAKLSHWLTEKTHKMCITLLRKHSLWLLKQKGKT